MKKMLVMLFIILAMVVTVNAQTSIKQDSVVMTAMKGQTNQKRSLSFAHALYLVDKMMQKPDSISWLTYEEAGDNLGGIYIAKNHEVVLLLDTAVFQQRMIILGNLPLFVNSINVHQIMIVSYPVSLSGDRNLVLSEGHYQSFIEENPSYR